MSYPPSPLMRVGAVARQEWRLLVRQRFTLVLCTLLLLALAAALANSWHQYQKQMSQQAALQAVVDQQWLDQPDRHPHRVAHFGTFAFRPPASLGFFDHGVDRYVGSSLFLEAHRQNPSNFAAASHATSISRFGDVSPAYLLQNLLPLLLLLLAGASVTREREQGTERLLVAQGLGLPAMVWGKSLAYGLAGALLVVLVVLTAALLVVLVENRLPLETLLALGAAMVLYALYAFFCALLAVSVSALSRDSRQALLVLASLWFVAVVVAPRVAPFWVQAGPVTASRVAFNAGVDAELRSLGDSHDQTDARFTAFRQQILDQYGVERVEDLPVNFGGLLMQEGERRTSEVFARHYQALQRDWDARELRLRLVGLVNPALAVRQASAALAGTDRTGFSHFERQAEAYRYSFIQHLNHIHAHEIDYTDDRSQRVSNTHWRSMPLFDYQPEPLPDRLWRAASAPAILLVWLVLGLAFWQWHARRQP